MHPVFAHVLYTTWSWIKALLASDKRHGDRGSHLETTQERPVAHAVMKALVLTSLL